MATKTAIPVKLDAICARLKTGVCESDCDGSSSSMSVPVNDDNTHLHQSDRHEKRDTDMVHETNNNKITDSILLSEAARLQTNFTNGNDQPQTSKKNKRKSQTPRSIAQYCESTNIPAFEDDDDEDYEFASGELDDRALECEDIVGQDNEDRSAPGDQVEHDAVTTEYETVNCQTVPASQQAPLTQHPNTPCPNQTTDTTTKYVECRQAMEEKNDHKEDEVLDLSCPSKSHPGDALIDYVTDDNGAMDLSMPSKPSSSSTSSSLTNSGTSLAALTSKTIDSQPQPLKEASNPLRSLPVKPAVSIAPADASTMKNYAENTMQELLRMYGFNDDASAGTLTITDKVPLQNFMPGSILQRNMARITKTSDPRILAKKVLSPPVSQLASSTASTPLPEGQRRLMPADQGNDKSAGHVVDGEFCDVQTNNGGQELARAAVGTVNTSPVVSSTFIKTGFGPLLTNTPPSGSPGHKALLPDYTRYVKRYTSHEECGGNHCHDMAYKEHFHCMDCSFRVFVKKEEMIRHFKWHKKRDESLQHGFLRFSPTDDCTKKFGSCTHNGRQTHYHCLQAGCSKVYISTSDVQMHANYHRKDSAIIQEGFQRFRATEDCGSQNCAFYGQRTTHFHCRRDGCSFTFKNKADMEKHKTYHQKDEMLSKDGFKKFMKYEHCSFNDCRYSKISNHIHCIRPGCNYVLHSTGQLYSHKRKHERRDFEHAYKRYREEHKTKAVGNYVVAGMAGKNNNEQTAVNTIQGKRTNIPKSVKGKESANFSVSVPMPMAVTDDKPVNAPADFSKLALKRPLSDEDEDEEDDDGDEDNYVDNNCILPLVKREETEYEDSDVKLCDKSGGHMLLPVMKQEPPVNSTNASQPDSSMLGESPNGMADSSTDLRPPTPQMAVCSSGFVPSVTPAVNDKKERDESWKKYLTRYTANDPCHSRCQFLYKDHYHCNTAACGLLFRAKDGVREHAKHHEQQDRVTSCSFITYEEGAACKETCKLNKGPLHYHCVWNDCGEVISSTDQYFSRLEHHKIHEYSRVSAGTTRKQAMMHHFKLPQDNSRKRRGRPPKFPRTEIPLVPKIEMTEKEIEMDASISPPDHPIASGFRMFQATEPCPDEKCLFYLKEHYHCVRQRCHHSTDRNDVLNLHAKDFHNYVTILEGFEFFDRNINCRRPHCHNNRANRHFHCVRPKCDYSFVRYSTMAQHDKKHKMAEMGLTPSPSIAIPKSAILPKGLPSNAPVNITQQLSDASKRPMNVEGPVNTQTQPQRQILPLIGQPQTGAVMVATNTMQAANGGQVLLTLPSAPNTSVLPGSQVLLQVPASANMNMQSAPPPLIAIAPKLAGDGSGRNDAQALLTTQPLQLATPVQTLPTTSGSTSAGLPLTVLLQQPATSTPQLNWLAMEMKMHFGQHQICGRPFCKLKKKDHFHCFECHQAFSDIARLRSHVGKHGIKVDKTNAIHSELQNSAMSGQIPLSPTDQDKDNDSEDDEEESYNNSRTETVDPSSSLNLNPELFSNMFNQQMVPGAARNATKSDSDDDDDEHDLVIDLSRSNSQDSSSALDGKRNPEQNDDNVIDGDDVSSNVDYDDQAIDEMDEDPGGQVTSPGSQSSDGSGTRRSGRKRTATRHDGFIDSDIAVAKMRCVSNSYSTRDARNMEITSRSDQGPQSPFSDKSQQKYVPEQDISLKLAQVPRGYKLFGISEDCNIERCAYRRGMAHYHCNRPDCFFAVLDNSKFLQHSANHRKLDELMGEEFEQFHSNTDCQRADCQYANQAKHFHCLKCPFICTDNSKVAVHRKQHLKLENVKAQGFVMCVAGESCGFDQCIHSFKMLHYHCAVINCGQVAMGPAQMSAHKVKHLNAAGLKSNS